MPADAFALLGLPRTAALSGDEVRAAFQKAAAASHPDAAADETERAARTAQFTALNEASATLSSLTRRLRHLLELEYPEIAAQKSAAPLDHFMMDLFSKTAAAVQRAAAVQAQQRTAASALARAVLAPEEMHAREQLEAAASQVDAARDSLERSLSQIDDARSAGNPGAGAMLSGASVLSAFFEKWQAQLRAAFAGFFAA